MNNVFVYITLFFFQGKQIVNIKPKHLKLIQMHLKCVTKTFAFECDPKTFAFECVDMHLLTSMTGAFGA